MHSQNLSKERPGIADQFRKRLIFITAMLLSILLLWALINIYTTTAQARMTVQAITLHDNVNQLLSAMVDQETGLRGYITTANPTFLEPFKRGRSLYISIITLLNTELHSKEFHDTLPVFYDLRAKAYKWYAKFALQQQQQIRMGNLIPRSEKASMQGKLLFDQFRISIAHLQQRVDSDIMSILDRQRLIDWCTQGIAILLSLCTFVLLWHIFTLLQRDLTTQLTILRQVALQFSAGDRQVRVHLLKHEELEVVGQTLNRLMDTVQQQEIALEENIKDVEHVNGEFRALFNAVKSAIMFVSSNGDILTINHSFSEFFQFSPESIIGLPFNELQVSLTSFFIEPFPTWVAQDICDADKTETFTASLTQVIPTKRDLEMQMLPVYSTASVYIGCLYLWRDVTREHELDQMKRNFVAQVSHELRAPLTSIKGFVDLLLEESDRLSKDQQEFLLIVQENTRRLALLVNDLLDLSHIESGKLQLECTTIALNPLITSILASFTRQIDNMHQQLEIHLTEPSPVIFADTMRVQQIITNLVSNAHKYTLEGGILRISTQLEGQHVWVIVQDSGIGMTPEEQIRLFSRFFRAKNKLTENIGGTGLGLLITRSLVEQHGGTIQVESQSGQGSTFRFTLPLALETPQPITPSSF